MTTNKNVTRPHYSFWVIGLVFIALGGLLGGLPTLPTPNYPHGMPFFSPVPLMCFGFFAALGLPFVLWALITQIVWDEDGFCSRSFRGKMCAKWSDIADYTTQTTRAAKTSETLITYSVYLKNGKKVAFARRWSNHEALRDTIQERAMEARVTAWDEEGLRSVDTEPQTYIYNVRGARAGIIILPLVMLLALLPMLIESIPKITNSFQVDGWQWGIGTVAMFSIYFLLVGSSITVMSKVAFADILRRGGESITISHEGICYSDTTRTVDASWSSVSDYCIDKDDKGRYQYTVRVTGAEQPIRFSRSITRSAELTKYIERYAPTPPSGKPWHRAAASDDTLGAQVTPFSKDITGKRIYHYRTRTNRVLLLYPTILVVITPLVNLLRTWVSDGTPSFGDSLPIFGIGGIVIAYAWWRYFAACVVTDEQGITQYAPFGRYYLAWSEVNEWRVLKQDMASHILLHGPYNRRVRAFQLIAEVAILKDEIQERTGLAPVEVE